MREPYIGVTGIFTEYDLAILLGSAFSGGNTEFPDGYQLMVGVLASGKTLDGIPSERFPNRYPAIESIPDLFAAGNDLLNLIHFNSREPNFSSQLEKLVRVCGPNLAGFQLNICWPDPIEIMKFREAGHDHAIVLQIGESAFKSIEEDPRALANKLGNEYKGLVDYILLDPSGGEGKEMDISRTDSYLEKLYGLELNNSIRFGIAGGLHSGNLEKIRPLVEKYDSLSIDAEGKLRHKSDDTMNHEELQNYLIAAKKLFNQQGGNHGTNIMRRMQRPITTRTQVSRDRWPNHSTW
ncbi:MAG TPA: hypothetical protein PKD79_03685 [Candidatus Doudnabacteria bacterium]|nr:hypothetical protein [Candidatus Doudnabacteria bacterium]